MTPDLIYDQMIGMGCAKKLVFSWGGNPGVGSLHRLRDAVERGWPNKLEIEEHSHAAIANAYEAGPAGREPLERDGPVGLCDRCSPGPRIPMRPRSLARHIAGKFRRGSTPHIGGSRRKRHWSWLRGPVKSCEQQ